MSKSKRRSAAAVAEVVAVEKPAKVEVVAANVPATKDSIRKTIRDGLRAGQSTANITQAVQEKFPNSAAAAKPAKHIAFYRSHMKKAGELPTLVTQAE